MTIRAQIVVSQAVIALAVAAIVAVAMTTLSLTNATREHMESSYEQLHGLMRVAQLSNRFAEQLAELLILGDQEVAELNEARADLGIALDELRLAVETELATLTDPEEREGEEHDLARIKELIALAAQMDDVVAALVPLVRAGDAERAAAVFGAEFEDRLDREFDAIIETALLYERLEVESALRASSLLAERSSYIVTLVALAALAASLLAGIMLHRALFRPIRALVEGADAVGRGDLSHRIGYRGGNELAHMAHRFNLMTEQLEEQRNRLLQAQQTLEDKVRERTTQLQDQALALEGANTRLRELDTQRIRFLTDVSHELRTPLTVLRGEAEVALRASRGRAAAYRDVLVRVVDKAAQIGRLVDDLMFLARSEAGSLRFDFQPVAMQAVVDEVVLDGRVLSEARRIAIRADSSDEPIVVRGDPHRLKQALMTVVDNAVKYAPHGSEVTISLTRRERHAQITVSDNGAGFAPDEINRAFERFYRGRPLAAPAREGARGTGLGLSIARWIAEKHEGHIDLASAPGQGTNLTILLPLADRR